LGKAWVANCAKDFLEKNPKLPYFEKKKVEFTPHLDHKYLHIAHI
jgi:hypothetical protein